MTTYSSPAERLGAFTITELKSSDHNMAAVIESAAGGSCSGCGRDDGGYGGSAVVLFRPSTLSQAQDLFDESRRGSEALNAIAAYVRAREDSFLGQRLDTWQKTTQGFNQLLYGQYLGYALHEDERPEHNMLELLQVLASQNPQDPLSKRCCNEFGSTLFTRTKRSLLRRIVFNNPVISTVSTSNSNDESTWKQWQARFNEHNRVQEKAGTRRGADSDDLETDDGGYIDDATLERLRAAFRKFDNFSKTVHLLRCSSLDLTSEHDWATRFLFPFGISTLFTEINKDENSKANIMAGQGQVLYTMLQRDHAQRRAEYSYADQDAAAAAAPAGGAACADAAGTARDVGRLLFETFFDDQDEIASFARQINASDQHQSNGRVYTRDESRAVQAMQDSARTSYDFDVRRAKALNLASTVINNSAEDNSSAASGWGSISAASGSGGGAVRYERELDCSVTRYMPYLYLPAFTRLREDIEALLCQEINKQDMFMHLSRIVTLNFAVYLLEQQQKMCNGLHEYEQQEVSAGRLSGITQKRIDDINMVLCAEDAGLRGLARLSHNRLDANNRLLAVSRDAYVRYRLNNFIDLACPFLKQEEDLNEAHRELLYKIRHACFNSGIELFDPRDDGFDPGMVRNCADLIKNSIEAIDEKRSHTSGAHRSMIKNTGMCSAHRNSALQHYSMTDRMLRTLVLTVMGQSTAKHMKLSDFMTRIYERYHIVIGPEQSRNYHSGPDESLNIRRDDFDTNEKHFKNSLARLNMLLVLSDECEYIRIPS